MAYQLFESLMNSGIVLQKAPGKLDYYLPGVMLLTVGITVYEILFDQLPVLFLVFSPFSLFAFIGSLSLYLYFIQNKTIKLMLPIFLVVSLIMLYKNLVYFLVVVFVSWLICGVFFLKKTLGGFDNNRRMVNVCCLYILFPLYVGLAPFLLEQQGSLHPQIMDSFLLAVDGALGFYPGLKIAKFIDNLPVIISSSIELVYYMLPVAFLLVYIKLEELGNSIAIIFVLEFIFMGVAGYCLYNIIPACGAKVAFGHFWPYNLPENFVTNGPQSIYISTTHIINSFPSLHIAWTMSLLRYGGLLNYYSKVWISGFVVITLIAVFEVGGHYLIDILAGLTLANLMGGMFGLTMMGKNRIFLLSIGLGITLCFFWYLMVFFGLRFLQSSPILTWVFFTASALISLTLEFKLVKKFRDFVHTENYVIRKDGVRTLGVT